jgi:A/G-specific adenine glycosylase
LTFSSDLLHWYDRNRRTFPWRAIEGQTPNPYHVWLSEMMLQQTTTKSVIPYFNHFVEKWPDVSTLSNATIDEVLLTWAGLGYYSRARNLHKAAQVLKHGFPRTEEGLLTLPGIGPYSANAISAIAYDLPCAPVDGNIARIFARLNKIDEVKPGLFVRAKALLSEVVPATRNGDFIQGLMDIGATICTPQRPSCEACPLSHYCLSFKEGCQDSYPLKPEKKRRANRYGVAFWIEDDLGRVLLRRRPEKGLLGGMIEFPSTPWLDSVWTQEDVETHYPLSFDGIQMNEVVEHTFTHFHLILNLQKGRCLEKSAEGLWVAYEDLKLHALPTLMKKVAKVVLAQKA